MSVVSNIVFANGVYDIACAFSILFPCLHDYIPLSSALAKLHSDCFRERSFKKSRTAQCILAYWILTYGVVRTFIHLNDKEKPYVNMLVAATYFIESYAFGCIEELESWADQRKSYLVSLASTVLGFAALFNGLVEE